MGYKHFTFQVLARVLFIFGLLCLLAYLLVSTSFVLSTVVTALVVLGLVWELIRFVNGNNRQMSRFFLGIAQDDFSQKPKMATQGSSWDEMQRAYSLITDKLQQLQSSREEKHNFLELLTDRAGVGLMTFDAYGNVHLMNEEAKKLFGLPYIRSLSALNRLAEGLGERLLRMQPNEHYLLRCIRDNDFLQLSVRATYFRQQDRQYTLLSLQHIGAELEEQEFMAWQKLISVLTHEVMNSVTPIISLAGTAQNILQQNLMPLAPPDQREDYEDLATALQTIEKRSSGMLGFVDAYRRLSRVPVPELQAVPVKEFFTRIERLFAEAAKEKGISLHLPSSGMDHEVLADPELTEQVFINVIKNALEAPYAVPDKKITVTTGQDESFAMVYISNNGESINAELADKIFIPFFSTKAEGSGVGLSICRQIMRAQDGDIYLRPSPQEGVCFALKFRTYP